MPCFAVAVRDNSDLFLYLSVCRSKSGDVYVNFPRNNRPGWKPHTSYHASGQHHHKSFDHRAYSRKGQKPDSTFYGIQNIVTVPIAADEPRKINVRCRPSEYEDVFEIPVSELHKDMYRTLISVDIGAPDTKPVITPASRVVRQVIFKGVEPSIFVTLFETSSNQ